MRARHDFWKAARISGAYSIGHGRPIDHHLGFEIRLFQSVFKMDTQEKDRQNERVTALPPALILDGNEELRFAKPLALPSSVTLADTLPIWFVGSMSE
jgi:hypothetical protein